MLAVQATQASNGAPSKTTPRRRAGGARAAALSVAQLPPPLAAAGRRRCRPPASGALPPLWSALPCPAAPCAGCRGEAVSIGRAGIKKALLRLSAASRPCVIEASKSERECSRKKLPAAEWP